jgi:hypothetical protein
LLVDAGEEPVEQVGAVGLVMFGGVVALAEQGGPELDAGLEERAGFADGFEGAVEFGWAGAAAVAEQAVVLAAYVCRAGAAEHAQNPTGAAGVEVFGLAFASALASYTV